MNEEEFKTKLKQAGLTKLKFAELTDMNRGSVSNWQQEGKSVPGWVDSWLVNYIEAKAFQKVKDAVKDADSGYNV